VQEGAALKGRQTRVPYMVCNPMLFSSSADWSHLPLLSGRDFLFDRFLGLKPQAQSYSPFGTKIARTKISGLSTAGRKTGLAYCGHSWLGADRLIPPGVPEETSAISTEAFPRGFCTDYWLTDY
jgi:hypothetical protein